MKKRLDFLLLCNFYRILKAFLAPTHIKLGRHLEFVAVDLDQSAADLAEVPHRRGRSDGAQFDYHRSCDC